MLKLTTTQMFQLKCAALLLVLHAALVIGYSDVRYASCMNEYLTQKVPMNRSQWSGVIEMVMKCDEGYDFPLNAPEGGVFRCKPDMKAWEPSYVPDCNKKKLPKGLKLVLGIPSSSADECQKVPTQTGDGNTIQIGGKRAQLHTVCGSKLSNCKLTKVVPVCTGSHPGQDLEEDFWIKQFEMNGDPFVAMIISIKYNPKADGNTILNHANTVRDDIESVLGIDDIEVKLKADCESGSLGIVTSGGQFLCRGCSLGHFLDRKQKKCQQCDAGKYQDEPLSLQCKVCPSLFDLQDAKIKQEIKKKYDKGSFSLIFCPSLTKDKQLRDPYAQLGKPSMLSTDIKVPGALPTIHPSTQNTNLGTIDYGIEPFAADSGIEPFAADSEAPSSGLRIKINGALPTIHPSTQNTNLGTIDYGVEPSAAVSEAPSSDPRIKNNEVQGTGSSQLLPSVLLQVVCAVLVLVYLE